MGWLGREPVARVGCVHARFDVAHRRQGRKGGPRKKCKNCKTNPSLTKPAWTFPKDKAKNEPKLGRSWGSVGVFWTRFWGLEEVVWG